MDPEFECSSCGEKFDKAAYALVMYSPAAFAKILIFCSKECYRIPFHKALGGLTPEQRRSLQNITIWIWDGEDHFGIIVPDAEYLFKAFEEKRAEYEEHLRDGADDRETLEFEEEKNDSVSEDQSRKLRRILLSTRPEHFYPGNFKALYFLLRGPIPEDPRNCKL